MRIGMGQACVSGVSTDQFGNTIVNCGPDASLDTGDSMVIAPNLPLSSYQYNLPSAATSTALLTASGTPLTGTPTIPTVPTSNTALYVGLAAAFGVVFFALVGRK
jgi:hypothetical protein